MPCSVDQCAFFANEGCYGTCSQHSVYKPVKILSLLKPKLPKDVLDVIWEFSRKRVVAPLADNEILSALGRTAEEVFVGQELIGERLLWLQNRDLPYLHCDDIRGALHVLQLPVNRKIRRDDAVRLMAAIDQRNPQRYSRIALEKAIVIKTLNSAALPGEVFAIGLCYHGGAVVTNQTPVGTLRQLLR